MLTMTQRVVHNIASVAFACAVAASGRAAIVHVPSDYPTIQAGIDAAQSGDTVLVTAGTYIEAIKFKGKALTLEASAEGALGTIINAQGQGASTISVPAQSQGQVIIRGFRITGGTGKLVETTIRGGGVHIEGGNTIIENCEITMNSVGGVPNGVGGGIWISGGALTLRNCAITSNGASANNTCPGFSSASGGGIFSAAANLTMIQCTISNNVAVASGCFGTMGSAMGGGLYLGGENLLINCVIRANVCFSPGAFAGGIYTSASTTLIGCEVSKNDAASSNPGAPFASGIANTSVGNLTLRNCTISDNLLDGSLSVGVGAAGVYNGTASSNPQHPPVNISNCIIFGNSANEISGPANVDHSCIEGGYTGDDNIAANPQFVDTSDADYTISVSSPARDIGELGQLPSDDFDLDGDGDTKEHLPLDALGLRRVVNGYVDMGAYEWQRTCEADISPSSPGVAGNGTIDVDDLLAVINSWGECDGCIGDINGDNAVNVDDLLSVINGWGACK